MRWLAVLLLVGSCATMRGLTAPNADIDAAVIQFLDRIHSEFDGEIALCLTGQRNADGSVSVDGVKPLWLTGWDEDSVDWMWGACFEPEVVGIAHNHPSGGCGLSGRDLRSQRARKDPIWLVSCGDGYFAWRIRGRSEDGYGKLLRE